MKITRDHVKKAVSFVVGASVGSVVKTIIQNNTDPDTKLQEAEVLVSSYVLGAMVATAACEYTDKKVDHYADKVVAMKEPQITTENQE